MRKGTFSVQKATSNSTPHNSRTNPPKYLIGLESGSKNYYELIKSDNVLIQEAQEIYKEKIKQKMQKKQVENLIQETVLTLQPNQNENDVKELFKKLNKKYGGHELLEVSIHRDEGHFLKNGIAYYPTKNILKKNDEWFVCSDVNIKKPKKDDFDTKVDISKYKKIYNYHAHAKFSMFDRFLGKSARMQKKDMSSRIKFVSKELGLDYSPETKTRTTKSVNQIKDEHLAKARGQEKTVHLAKERIKEVSNELKEEIAELRAELKEAKATRPDYAELEALNRKLQEEVNQNDRTMEEMQIDLKQFKYKFQEATKEKEHFKSLVEVKEIEIEELKEEVYHPTMTYTNTDKKVSYKHLAEHRKEELNTLKEEIKELKERSNSYFGLNTELKNQIKSLQEQKEVLEVKVIDLEEKSVSRPITDDYNNKKMISNVANALEGLGEEEIAKFLEEKDTLRDKLDQSGIALVSDELTLSQLKEISSKVEIEIENRRSDSSIVEEEEEEKNMYYQDYGMSL